MAKMMSKVFSASIRRRISAVRTTGITIGSVTQRMICHSLAPSIRAASTGSSDSPASPASTISVIIGVHCQTSTSTSEASTVFWCDTHNPGGNPNEVSTKLKKPIVGS